MTDHDASFRRQALYTLRNGTEEQRRTAATYLHSDLQELVDRLNASAERAVEEMARSMFEGLDRALSWGDDAAPTHGNLPRSAASRKESS